MPKHTSSIQNQTPILKPATTSNVVTYISRHFKDSEQNSNLVNAQQVAEFVRTPNGRSVQNYILREIAIMAAQKRQSEFLAQQEYLQEIRLLGILALLKEDSNDKTLKLNQAITQQQYEKLLKKLMKQSESKPNSVVMINAYRETLSDYTALRDTLLTARQMKQIELVQINKQIAAIKNALPAAKTVFTQAMNNNPQVQRIMNQIKVASALPSQTRRQQLLTAHAQARAQAAAATAPTSIATKAQPRMAPEQQMQHQIREVIEQIAHIYAQQRLRDEINRTEGAQLYTAAGKITKKYDEAAFIVPAERKIVSHAGQYYVLKPRETLEALSGQQRDQARVTDQYHTAQTTGLLLAQKYHNSLRIILAQLQTQMATCQSDLKALDYKVGQVEAVMNELSAKIKRMEQDPTFNPEESRKEHNTQYSPTPSPTGLELTPGSHRKMMAGLNPGGSIQAQQHPSSAASESTFEHFVEILKTTNRKEMERELEVSPKTHLQITARPSGGDI